MRKPATYTDKASLFQTAAKGVHHRQAPAEQPTQIGRALKELDIEWIAAHSPQAKGRVERFFGTAQDRLVKGLRKVGASNREEANRYLEQVYLPMWKRRFAREAEQAGDAHRTLDGRLDLNSVLSRVEVRTVAQDYTVRWAGAAYQIRRTDIGGGMRGKQVEIEQRLDQTMWMRWKQRRLQLDRCGRTETQLSSCLDSAPGGTETGRGRTTTASTASTGSLQRSLSTRAGATSVAGSAQLNGYYMDGRRGRSAFPCTPSPKAKPKSPKRKFLLG